MNIMNIENINKFLFSLAAIVLAFFLGVWVIVLVIFVFILYGIAYVLNLPFKVTYDDKEGTYTRKNGFIENLK